MKSVIILASILLCSSPVGAFFELAITPKVGIGLSYMSGIDQNRIREGFGGGIALSFYFVDPLCLETGLLFQMKGTKGRGLNYHYGYLSIPVTLRVRVIEHFSFFAGVQTSFLLYGKAQGITVTEQSNLLGLDIVFGASYYFFVKGGKLIFEFAIEAGLIDLTNDNHPFSGAVNKNRSAYISVGWEFSLYKG